MAKLQAVDAAQMKIPSVISAGMECPRCGSDMKLESLTKHSFSEVEYLEFVCGCGTQESRVLSRSAFSDD